LARLAGLGRVEILAGHRVGEGGQRAPVIDFPLGALRLQFVEDAGQQTDLTLVQLQLVSQEAQRPADAETSALLAFLGAAPRPGVVSAAMTERVPGVAMV